MRKEREERTRISVSEDKLANFIIFHRAGSTLFFNCANWVYFRNAFVLLYNCGEKGGNVLHLKPENRNSHLSFWRRKTSKVDCWIMNLLQVSVNTVWDNEEEKKKAFSIFTCLAHIFFLL